MLLFSEAFSFYKSSKHVVAHTSQELPESQRADAVTSMVYEASARIRDPVYGCAGAICQLQKQVNELQAQLAKSQAELVTMQLQQANLVALICMEMAQNPQESPQQSVDNFISTPPHSGGYQSGINNFFEDNTSPNSLWEPLWTWNRIISTLIKYIITYSIDIHKNVPMIVS